MGHLCGHLSNRMKMGLLMRMLRMLLLLSLLLLWARTVISLGLGKVQVILCAHNSIVRTGVMLMGYCLGYLCCLRSRFVLRFGGRGHY